MAAERSATRHIPVGDVSGEPHFLIDVDAADTEMVAVRLRATFMGADVQTNPSGLIRVDKGTFGQGWRGLTATEVDEAVQETKLLHIVLGPDPAIVDAIQMRVNRELVQEQIKHVVALGLSIYQIEVPPYYHGYLYRLAPRVGNEWPSRDQIADALNASRSSPQQFDRW